MGWEDDEEITYQKTSKKIMIKKLVTALFCLITAGTYAQRNNSAVQISHYVLDSFRNGKVLVKSGALYEQLLNYNVLTQEMIFWNGSRFLAIANPKDVDTIFIGARKFIPVNEKFYELLTGTSIPLFVEFSYKIDEPPVSVGYGNASPTTNSTSLTSLVTSGAVYDINLPADFKVIPLYNYYLRKEGKYEKVNSAQQLIKVFPDKKDMIKELIKKNHTNFEIKDDVIKLVQEVQQRVL
jgi:hypothetical protein